MLAPPRVDSLALPRRSQPWPLAAAALRMGASLDPTEATFEQVRDYALDKPWVWPSRAVLFFCDIHADTDAFLLSLVASGGVARTGRGDHDFELTELGQQALFIVGGDCFDKGPENLRLLRCLGHLMRIGADVRILAGNHDLRTYVGISYAGRREVKLRHLFVRMGKKTIPLFAEIFREMCGRGEAPTELASDAEVRELLFPDESWYARFEQEVRGLISPKKLAKEVRRIREKSADLEVACRAHGLSLGALHAALLESRRLFCEPGGEFGWYFNQMTLAVQQGSFLFVHAGVDDVLAEVIGNGGVGEANAWYEHLFRTDLFTLYHGSVGNAFRTKYRDIDFPLTERGVQALRGEGIYAIVHGHRNLLHGQRITLRAGVLNFECDASVDRNTRLIEGLAGPGGAAVVFEPSGRLTAISTDYPFAKTLDAGRVFAFTSLRPGPHTTGSDRAMETTEPIEEQEPSEATEASEGISETEPEVQEEERRKQKAKIKFESLMQRGEAVSYFSALVDGLRHGRLQFKQRDETVELEPGERVQVEVKASKKGDKEKVSFELSWRTGTDAELEVSA